MRDLLLIVAAMAAEALVRVALVFVVYSGKLDAVKEGINFARDIRNLKAERELRKMLEEVKAERGKTLRSFGFFGLGALFTVLFFLMVWVRP